MRAMWLVGLPDVVTDLVFNRPGLFLGVDSTGEHSSGAIARDRPVPLDPVGSVGGLGDRAWGQVASISLAAADSFCSDDFELGILG